jgi:hypothetical protein
VEEDVCWKMDTAYARLPKVWELTREKRKHANFNQMASTVGLIEEQSRIMK